MARSMAVDDTELFRAVITTIHVGERWKDGRHVATEVVGPYRTKAAALQAISRSQTDADHVNRHEKWMSELRDRPASTTTVEARVERAAVSWEPVV